MQRRRCKEHLQGHKLPTSGFEQIFPEEFPVARQQRLFNSILMAGHHKHPLMN
jgi:hypothetical protein